MQARGLRSPIRLAGASLLRLQSDARLVDLARDGHDPAFAAIVDRYRPALVRYAARLLGRERAEDAVQHALLKAFTALRDSDSDTEIDVRPWLYRIVHNTALNVLRATRDEAPLDERAASGDGPHEIAERQDRLRRTLAAVEALPAHQRDAIVLRELEGRSHDEIAAALGITAGAARQHLHRARSTLRTAVTAVTPYGVIVRAIEGASDGRIADLAAGAGIGASVAKVGVAALATTTLVGGVVTTRHVVSSKGDHANAAPALHRKAAAGGRTGRPAAPRPDLTPGGSVVGDASRGRAGGRRGRAGERPRRQRGGDQGSRNHGDDHGSIDGGRRGDDTSEFGDDGHRSGSGTSGSSSGDDRHRSGNSGSSSGDDRHRSGNSGSSSGDDRHRSGNSGGNSGDDRHRSGSGTSDSHSGDDGRDSRIPGDDGGSGRDHPPGTSGTGPRDDAGSGTSGSTPDVSLPRIGSHGSGDDRHVTDTRPDGDAPLTGTGGDSGGRIRDSVAGVLPSTA